MSIPVSFEYFPPKSAAGAEKLLLVHQQLARLQPAYASVTYGAGGSTRERTLQTVQALQAYGVDIAPHLSCIGDSRERLREILAIYRAQGLRRIVALRGDLPSGQVGLGDLPYAVDLVRYIRAEHGEHFQIEVAAYPEQHPQAENYEQGIDHFLAKIDAGADAAITQYFFNIDAYEHFVNRVRARGYSTPITPGIMPISHFSNLLRFSEACGAEIPRWLKKQLSAYGDDTSAIAQLGEEFVGRLCEKLIALGAPSLHFYTMNQYEPTHRLCLRLGLMES